MSRVKPLADSPDVLRPGDPSTPALSPPLDSRRDATGSTTTYTPAKIKPRHSERRAVVYVRQSTTQQVTEHPESLARQYALRDRAQALGWPSAQIEVIDEDLGQSGRSSDARTGFQRILADVAQDRVGVVLGLEMSRLARNSRDWHNLFDLCAVRDTLLADEDGTYDPQDVNDRLILGLKGIMSEMELHNMKNRLERARVNKAKRGELFHSVPRGYVRLPDNRVELDPDEEVRTAIRLVFDKFDELGSAYAVLRYLVRHNIRLPRRDRGGRVLWRRASEDAVNGILHHPIYAGAYTWGRQRTEIRVDAAGRITSHRRSLPMDEWKVLLRDRLPAYISWEQFLKNRQRFRQNRPRSDTPGAARGGAALVAGLLYCERCGRKMQPSYSGQNRARYDCSRRRLVETDEVCGGFPARVLDELIAAQVLQALQPAALELSLHAVEQAKAEREHLHAHFRQRLDRAAYEAERAERQYQNVEPENRLVARTLEQHWEAALGQQRDVEQAYADFRRETPAELSESDRERLQQLTHDIPALWFADITTHEDRQQIVRCLVERVTAAISDEHQRLEVTIQWAGGYLSRHELVRPVGSYAQLDDLDDLVARAVELRRAGWRAPRIAETLNAEGFRPPKQRGPFTADLARLLFSRRGPAYGLVDDRELGPGEWTTAELAQRLNLKEKKVKDWVTRGWLSAVQRPLGGRWIVWADDEEFCRLKQLVSKSRPGMTNYAPELIVPKTIPQR